LEDTIPDNVTNYVSKYEKIFVFPNPTNNQLYLQGYEVTELQSYEIFNVVGQCVGAYPCGRPAETGAGASPARTIDVSHLAKGMYFLKINGKMVKFVKE
jgi:hypothetical protein